VNGDRGWEHRLLSRDSLTAGLALAVIGGLCWWYLFQMANGMASMTQAASFHTWTPAYFAMMVVMWVVMMVAMMLPSATPMILLYRQVARKNRLAYAALGTLLFALGYFVIWTCFSLVATLFQWLLERQALLSPMMRSQSAAFSGLILIVAGIYQWSPLKTACLRHCRGPLFFIARHWYPGRAGAFRMGLIHGAYCVGCCGALMALLFVGGVMNLTVVAVIAGLVLLEKLLPGGEWLAVALGLVAVGLGLMVLVSGL
jgi:predicted metal-binding membrane protein